MRNYRFPYVVKSGDRVLWSSVVDAHSRSSAYPMAITMAWAGLLKEDRQRELTGDITINVSKSTGVSDA